jgi:pseudouridine synthase
MSDEFHRPCVKDLFEKLNIREKLFTVGRLDYDSEGLMIATNDGELANKISHPRFEVQKTYKVILTSPVNERVEKRLLRGVVVEGKRVEISSLNLSDDRKQIELTIHEGRNRIVRKLMEKVGYSKLIRLIRIRIGGLELKNMREGQFREVTREELEREIKLQKKTSENKEGNTKTFVPEKEKPVKKEGEKSKSQLKRLAERQNRYRIKNRQ